MKKLTNIKLPVELKSHFNMRNIPGSPAYEIHKYSELVKVIAKISYENEDQLLFFRGQSRDYLDQKGNSTFLPTIYRGSILNQIELDYRFDILETKSKILGEAFKKAKIRGHKEVNRKTLIKWSILQHYEVCQTPLADVTQSLRVASSFALLGNKNAWAYIYVFGLPYMTNRISINSEQDLINIRLLSISPPEALRPYFQEGFLVGTSDLTTELKYLKEYDLSNRLIAKLKIPTKGFWDSKFSTLPLKALYPKDDQVLRICDSIKNFTNELTDVAVGEFLQTWVNIENIISQATIKHSGKNKASFSVHRNLQILNSNNSIKQATLATIDRLKKFRNKLVHDPVHINQRDLRISLSELKRIEKEIEKNGL